MSFYLPIETAEIENTVIDNSSINGSNTLIVLKTVEHLFLIIKIKLQSYTSVITFNG